MAESTSDEVEDLLREGLDYYGADEIGKAIQAWEKVLELDPDNGEAQDYIQTADRRSEPRPKDGSSAPAPAIFVEDELKPEEELPTNESAAPNMPPLRLCVLDEARERIDSGDYEGALGFLHSGDSGERCGLELQATVELVRSHLYARYRERIGALDAVPELIADGATITKFNLPSDAGFVLSLIDGSTSVADMISVSGMDPFDTLRILQGLLEVEIVRMRT